MQRTYGWIAHRIVVSALVSATLVGNALEAEAGQGQSGTGSGSPSRKTSQPRESTQITILPDTDFKKLEFLERYCFDEVNSARRSNGLSALKFFDDLVPVARRYSRRMAEEGFFSHTDPDGLTLTFRLTEARIKSSQRAENLSRIGGFLNPMPEVVRSWMKSPGHRENMLYDKYTHSAVGVWITIDDLIYVTQIFIR